MSDRGVRLKVDYIAGACASDGVSDDWGRSHPPYCGHRSHDRRARARARKGHGVTVRVASECRWQPAYRNRAGGARRILPEQPHLLRSAAEFRSLTKARPSDENRHYAPVPRGGRTSLDQRNMPDFVRLPEERHFLQAARDFRGRIGPRVMEIHAEAQRHCPDQLGRPRAWNFNSSRVATRAVFAAGARVPERTCQKESASLLPLEPAQRR